MGVLASGKMSAKDAAMYILFQIIGAFIASGLLWVITQGVEMDYATTTGANACAPGVSVYAAFLAEMIGTFIFVLVVLGVTDSEKGNSSLAGLAIGLSLILIHIVLIPLTGTSVNPVRSIAPAVFEGGQALSDLWIFICAPLVGGILSALVWKGLNDSKQED